MSFTRIFQYYNVVYCEFIVKGHINLAFHLSEPLAPVSETKQINADVLTGVTYLYPIYVPTDSLGAASVE